MLWVQMGKNDRGTGSDRWSNKKDALYSQALLVSDYVYIDRDTD